MHRLAAPQDDTELEFPGSVVLVAGGAHGLGCEIARSMTKQGAQVYISGDLVTSGMLMELSALEPGICTVLPKNLEAAEDMVAEVMAREEALDILIDDASAGWSPVFARAAACYELLSCGVPSAPAHIVTITSSASADSAGLWDSKVATVENARAMAMEFSNENVVVNSVEAAGEGVSTKDVIDMVMHLCAQSSEYVIEEDFFADERFVTVAKSSNALPLIEAKL